MLTARRIEGEGSHPDVAAAIVWWVREMGSDTDNVRDAAHEASHAIEYGVDEWDRRSIDVAVLRRPRVEQVRSEVTARAVEQVVCEALGVEHDWPHFMFLACMESMKVGNVLPGPEWLTRAVQDAKNRHEVLERAHLILSVGMASVTP